MSVRISNIAQANMRLPEHGVAGLVKLETRDDWHMAAQLHKLTALLQFPNTQLLQSSRHQLQSLQVRMKSRQTARLTKSRLLAIQHHVAM